MEGPRQFTYIYIYICIAFRKWRRNNPGCFHEMGVCVMKGGGLEELGGERRIMWVHVH
jgi:hypothetical protein